MNKAIDSILSIETFEQQCVAIKGMLQSSRLEDHMNTIGIEQLLCKKFFYNKKYEQHKKDKSICW